MQIKGTIRSTGDRALFTREAWCQLVSGRSELRRHAPRQIRNPFTGETTTVRAGDDAAEVLLGGRSVGSADWSMSDEPLVNISVEPAALPAVLEWAAALGGEFRREAADA